VLLFGDLEGDRGQGLLEALRDPAADLATELAFLPGRHPPHALQIEPRVALPISGAWFGGAERVQDLVACAC
jgi:hypothetical protein